MTLPIVVAGALLFLAYHTAGFNWPWQSPKDIRLFLGAATYGLILFADGLFVSTLHVTVPMLYEWLFPGEEVPPTMGQGAGRIVTVEQTPTSARSLVRPESPAGINDYQLWIMLREISQGRDTLSEETARDFRVVGDRDTYRRLVRWLVDNGLYVTANREDEYNNRQGGQITDRCRELASPTPTSGDAIDGDSPEVADERTRP